MDQRLAKEVKRLKGDEKYLKLVTNEIEIYKVLGILEASNTWQEFKELRERAKFRYAQFSMPEPDGFNKVLVNIFKKGKPPTTNKK